MKNKELLEKIKMAVKNERAITSEIISYLEMIHERMLYAEMGFCSLFDYCVRELGYSEAAAMRRINAMRISKDVPEVKQALEAGLLSLTAVSQVQRFVKEQKIKDPEVKRQLLTDAQGKSSREIERHFAKIAPQPIPQEKERVLTEDKTELRIVLEERVMQKLRRLRDKWSHRNTNFSYAELIEAMVDEVLKEPKQKPTPAPQATKTLKNKRIQNPAFMSAAAREREVWRRGKSKCAWPGCESTFLLQIDHIRPKIFGGSDDLDNLRLLCATHNRVRAPFQEAWKRKYRSIEKPDGIKSGPDVENSPG